MIDTIMDVQYPSSLTSPSRTVHSQMIHISKQSEYCRLCLRAKTLKQAYTYALHKRLTQIKNTAKASGCCTEKRATIPTKVARFCLRCQ